MGLAIAVYATLEIKINGKNGGLNGVKTELIAVNCLILDPSNARKHPEKNLEAIKGSLKKFGQQKPIVVGADNVVIAGNGTLEAARALGWKEISVVRSALKGSDATAFALADNKTQDLSVWDDDALNALLKSLKAQDYAVDEFGFADIFVLNEFEVDEKVASEKSKKYLLEIEFPDEQAMQDQYEKLLADGLIVRVK